MREDRISRMGQADLNSGDDRDAEIVRVVSGYHVQACQGGQGAQALSRPGGRSFESTNGAQLEAGENHKNHVILDRSFFRHILQRCEYTIMQKMKKIGGRTNREL